MPLYEEQRKRLMRQELRRRFGDNFAANPEASETLRRIRTEPAFEQEFINEAERGTMDSFWKYDALPIGLMAGGGLLTGLTGGAALPAIGLGMSGIGALGAAGVGGARIAEAAERQQYGLPNTGALVGGEGFGQSGWGALELAAAPLDIGIAAKQGINLARRGIPVVEDVLEKQLIGNTNYRKWKDPKLHLGPDGQPDSLLNILKEEDGSIILGRGQRSGDPISGQQTLSVMEVQEDGTLKAIRDADPLDLGMASTRQIDEGGRLVVNLPSVPSGAGKFESQGASGLLRELSRTPMVGPPKPPNFELTGVTQSQVVKEAAENLPPSGLGDAIQDIPEDEAFNQIRTIMDDVIDLDAGTILQHDMDVVSLVDDVFANLPEGAPVLQAHFRREAEAVDSLISSYRSIMEALPEFQAGARLWGVEGTRRPAAAQDFARLVIPGQAATVGTAGGRAAKARKPLSLTRRKVKGVHGLPDSEELGLSKVWGAAKRELKLFKDLQERFTGRPTKDYTQVDSAVKILDKYEDSIKAILGHRHQAEQSILKANAIGVGNKGYKMHMNLAVKHEKAFKAASTRLKTWDPKYKGGRPALQRAEEEMQRSLQSTIDQQLNEFKTLAAWWTKNIDVVRSQVNKVIVKTADKDTGAIAEEVVNTLAVDPKMLKRKDLLEVVSELINQQKQFTQKVGFERLFDGS